jgi:hypothetical protein
MDRAVKRRSVGNDRGLLESCLFRREAGSPWSPYRGRPQIAHKLLRSRAVVVSVVGKGVPLSASGVTPLMTCRNALDDIETGYASLSRDEPGGRLFIDQVVVRHGGGASVGQAPV